MKSISDKDVIYHKPLSEVKQHSFDVGKKSRKTPKNRQPIEGEEVTRRSTLSIRVCLKEFCVEFIKNCYNPLMRAVKSALERESSQENDETYYLWSTRFFMQFQRLYHFDVELVRETVTVQEFNYVYRILLNHLDMMMVDRKDAIIWAKRLHLALRTFKELLETLQAMSNSRSSQVRNSAKVIQQNVFYMQEYRDLLPFLLKKFNNTRNSKLYAKDLVETTHIYVRAMEKWCATQGKVLVQRKRKVVKRRKAANTPISTETPQHSQEELEEKWNILSDELSDLLQDVQEVVSDDVTPFDATSEVSIDEQRLECVKSIYTALHSSECTKAIALLRAAREVWPDNGEFGALDISAEDEFMLLREVFLADLSQGQTEGDEVLEEEMEGVEEQEVTQELEFDFRKFLMTFSSPKVVQVYTLLLTLYRNNDGHTNHCIVKMLHRIAVQNGMVALLFQLSVFRTFQKIFNDDSTKTSHFAELKTFATYVLRQFFKCVEKI
ncbi:TIMELESS [Bugula neritina]|uniref:TIMELESS n=1 Tax=Bugula neritina TaxID=10212 RepID=A0A7J7K8E3_BUGNE|nr:TIMELESS [Bugula neritina]